jgi:type II secretory pathway pseudopilin PulG
MKMKYLSDFAIASSRRLHRSERGIGLVESLIALAIIGTAVSAFITTLSTGSVIVGELNQETVAQQLAQSQMERIKAASYSPTGAGYTTISVPEGYGVAVSVDSSLYADSDIQKLTVTVSRDSETILTFEGYKVHR